jgi:FlgD Ig-like domain
MGFAHVWIAFAGIAGLSAGMAGATETYTWRYYRIGNTGIQGDYSHAVWVGPDGDPYIGGYDPIFEEGGFSKFIQSENRWVNYSNVDYPVIGHPNDLGSTRVNDIVPEVSGKLWLGTWLGALRFDPAQGASSLVHYGPGNSALIDDRIWDIDRAPDGTMWFVNGGIVRYNPASDTWTRWPTGEPYIAAQPKPNGGYLVWSSERPPFRNVTLLFDSDTETWTILTPTGAPNEVVGMPGKDCVDEAGNFWALRSTQPGNFDSMDYRKVDGTWVTPPEPYPGVTFDLWAFKAYGDRRAILVDGNGDVYQFSGTAWTGIGQWRPGSHSYSVDIDAVGNVWVSGVGGAAKRNVETGEWQRYRITNTGHFDNFTRDLTVDPEGNYVYGGANAGPGVGGMTRFDGVRWVGWNNATYGLGWDWPFPNDNCEALAYRPSNGRLVVSPLDWLYGIHEWTGSEFHPLPSLSGAVRMCEDSQGRLWGIGEYYSLHYHNGSDWTSVPITAWGKGITKDPTRPGTVWAFTGSEIVRTDGNYRFARTIGDFPELTDNSDQFLGVAADRDGVAWVGATALYDGNEGQAGVLIRIDADTGDYDILRSSQGWPFPGRTVTPWAVTPDGRLWMLYDTYYPYTERGLCWYDGTNVGTFPAPSGGEPQWGSLPHGQVEDLEVKEVPDGYELWMTCVSRGIAALTVQGTVSAVDNPAPAPEVRLTLAQNQPNPFSARTQIHFSLPQAASVRLDVYDVAGRLVHRLVDGTLAAGDHAVGWDGRANDLSSLPNGVYLYQLKAGGESVERRMLLLH